jgi:hypothetical protein
MAAFGWFADDGQLHYDLPRTPPGDDYPGRIAASVWW